MNTRTIVCEICGKAFCTTSTNAKYCSLECGAIGRAYKKRMWLDGRECYMRDYMRKYRKKQTATPQ